VAIIVAYPPLFDEIDRAFRVRGKNVFYSWGRDIYNPMDLVIPPELLAHEAAHGERQVKADINAWWREYIRSPSFRLREEIPAHQAEYRYLVEHAPNRNARRAALKQTAVRLAAPLYGRMTTVGRAKKLLRVE